MSHHFDFRKCVPKDGDETNFHCIRNNVSISVCFIWSNVFFQAVVFLRYLFSLYRYTGSLDLGTRQNR